MTEKERVLAVINGKKPDITPYFIEPTKKGKTKLAEYYGIAMESLETHMGNHLLYVGYSHPEDFAPEKLGYGLIRDEFGVTWNTEHSNDIGDWGMVDHPVKDMTLDGYDFPKPGGKGRFKESDRLSGRIPVDSICCKCLEYLRFPAVLQA